MLKASLGGLRQWWKDTEHGTQSVIRNVVEVDESWAEELGGETLNSVEILLHGGACISQDVETSTKNKLVATLLNNRYHASGLQRLQVLSSWDYIVTMFLNKYYRGILAWYLFFSGTPAEGQLIKHLSTKMHKCWCILTQKSGRETK